MGQLNEEEKAIRNEAGQSDHHTEQIRQIQCGNSGYPGSRDNRRRSSTSSSSSVYDLSRFLDGWAFRESKARLAMVLAISPVTLQRISEPRRFRIRSVSFCRRHAGAPFLWWSRDPLPTRSYTRIVSFGYIRPGDENTEIPLSQIYLTLRRRSRYLFVRIVWKPYPADCLP